MNFFQARTHMCHCTGWILKQSNLNQQAQRKKVPCEFDRFLLVRNQFDRAIISFYCWWTQSACVVCQCVRISITFITVTSNAHSQRTYSWAVTLSFKDSTGCARRWYFLRFLENCLHVFILFVRTFFAIGNCYRWCSATNKKF